MLLQACVLIHKNVPRATIQLYHLNLNILTHCKIYKFIKWWKKSEITFWKLRYNKKHCGNIDNKIEIVGYVTVFIYNIMGTPRSARINRKIAGKLSIFRDFYSEPLMQETFFWRHKISFNRNVWLFFYCNHFIKNKWNIN